MIGELLACVALGDSIAVGLAQTMECRAEAKVGASTAIISRRLPPPLSDLTVISAGSNDPASPTLAADLSRIRSIVHSARVVWILPRDRHAALAVLRQCQTSRDAAVDLASIPSPDGVHPESYQTLADQVAKAPAC